MKRVIFLKRFVETNIGLKIFSLHLKIISVQIYCIVYVKYVCHIFEKSGQCTFYSTVTETVLDRTLFSAYIYRLHFAVEIFSNDPTQAAFSFQRNAEITY